MRDRFWKAFVSENRIAQDYGNFILWLAGFKESEVKRAIETGLLKEDGVRNYEVENFKKFLRQEPKVDKILQKLSKLDATNKEIKGELAKIRKLLEATLRGNYEKKKKK